LTLGQKAGPLIVVGAPGKSPGEIALHWPERKILIEGFHHHLDTYRTDRAAALKLVSQGEFPRDEKLDPSDLAAYTTIASLLLNFDETVTKE